MNRLLHFSLVMCLFPVIECERRPWTTWTTQARSCNAAKDLKAVDFCENF